MLDIFNRKDCEDEMNEYTVILMRPDSIADRSVRFDIYVGLVLADTTKDAIRIAQDEVLAADIDDGVVDSDFDETYPMLAVFEGFHTPIAFGW